jgi:hypothetical protein
MIRWPSSILCTTAVDKMVDNPSGSGGESNESAVFVGLPNSSAAQKYL